MEVLYRKQNGKYVPVNDPYVTDGLTNGVWLVVVKSGSKSCRSKINPKLIEVEGALHYLHEGLCESMRKASEMRPRSIKMSKKEQRAWEAYKKIIGKEIPTYFEYASFSEIADAGCDYIKKILCENKMSVEKVKEKFASEKQKLAENSIMSLEV